MPGIAAHSRRALIALGTLAAASPLRAEAARKKKPKPPRKKPTPLVYVVGTVTLADSAVRDDGSPVFWVKVAGVTVNLNPDGSLGHGAAINVDAFHAVALPAAEARAAVATAVAEAAAARHGVPVARVQVVIH